MNPRYVIHVRQISSLVHSAALPPFQFFLTVPWSVVNAAYTGKEGRNYKRLIALMQFSASAIPVKAQPVNPLQSRDCLECGSNRQHLLQLGTLEQITIHAISTSDDLNVKQWSVW